MTQTPPDNLAGMSMAELLDLYSATNIIIGSYRQRATVHEYRVRAKAIRAELDARIKAVEEAMDGIDAIPNVCEALSRLKGNPHDLTTE